MRHDLDDAADAPRSSPASTAASSIPTRMTFAWWTIDEGAEVPEHEHPHEQVVNMLEGELVLTVDGTEHVLQPGDVVAIPGGVRHAARALSLPRPRRLQPGARGLPLPGLTAARRYRPLTRR